MGRAVASLSPPRRMALTTPQTRVLDRFIEAEAPRPGTFFDDLPARVRDALQRIKDQETLPTDVERYLDDNAFATRRHQMWASEVPTLREATIRLAASKPELRSVLLPMLRE